MNSLRVRHFRKGEVIGLKDDFHDSFLNVAIEGFQLDFLDGWEKTPWGAYSFLFFVFKTCC